VRFHTIAQHAGPAGLGENLEVVDVVPEGGMIPELDGNYGAFAPD